MPLRNENPVSLTSICMRPVITIVAAAMIAACGAPQPHSGSVATPTPTFETLSQSPIAEQTHNVTNLKFEETVNLPNIDAYFNAIQSAQITSLNLPKQYKASSIVVFGFEDVHKLPVSSGGIFQDSNGNYFLYSAIHSLNAGNSKNIMTYIPGLGFLKLPINGFKTVQVLPASNGDMDGYALFKLPENITTEINNSGLLVPDLSQGPTEEMPSLSFGSIVDGKINSGKVTNRYGQESAVLGITSMNSCPSDSGSGLLDNQNTLAGIILGGDQAALMQNGCSSTTIAVRVTQSQIDNLYNN